MFIDGGKLIEKYVENKFNLWRSIRIGQQCMIRIIKPSFFWSE